ncbi:MAG TPA: hypothetical protein VG929_04230 [Actinomycetota bacterium]|nr:hypothetical protein [Actinomycetota bacterium]
MTNDRPRPLPIVVGIALNLVWVAILFGICATDAGHLRRDWAGCVGWCALMALPAALAFTGLLRGSRGFAIAAAVVCAPLMLISLAGAGVPMIIPGILFVAGAAQRQVGTER